jgi:CHAT domain-containing protein/pimeloyl-ACP methyl ester carboxylesterase
MGNTGTTITLHIDGKLQSTHTVADWQADIYSLDAAARGTGEQLPAIALEPDTVLELELDDGTRILLAAEDTDRYFDTVSARGADSTTAVNISQNLRFSGTRLPEGTSRDGTFAWILKSLRIFRTGPSAMTALAAAGAYQDAQLGHRLGLYHCSTESWQLNPVEEPPKSAEPTLILIHGTASSSEGSFSGLWKDPGYLDQLKKIYTSRIYCFEHRSLTESPIHNALDLIKTLPDDTPLHLVSHSRGGLIGELLARANRQGEEPFSLSDISRFQEKGKHTGRSGFETQAKQLEELNREMRHRNLRIEKFVRVACPTRGTTLASGRLDRWASVMLNLVGKGFDLGATSLPAIAPVVKGYDLLQNFLLSVVKERTDARILPGLEAMMPDSPFVALLNAPGVNIDSPLHILAGDYDGENLLSWLGNCLSEIFYGGATDLVVNTPSMSGGAVREKGIFRKFLQGSEVHHFSYFRRDDSALALLEALSGDDSKFTLLDGPSQEEISRGGRETKPKENAPIALLLPGIMGSHIQIHTNRIWFDPFSMCIGDMEKLKIGAEHVTADGWMDRCYEKLARYLSKTHEVRPFAYDWRLSITAAAEEFAALLEKAMSDAEVRGKPVHIIAHSMGGLVARFALKNRWSKFKSIPGSRLLQLGTPNKGSHSIAAVLMGRDDFVQLIERWFDWKHGMREFIQIIREFPGVLELLPWPDDTDLAIDGVDYYSSATWQHWYDNDQDNASKGAWLPPLQKHLTAARNTVQQLREAELDPDCTLYVAGSGSTPVAVRVTDGKVEIGEINEGDGRVPWRTGIPAGVPVWYSNAAHGDLSGNYAAFAAYLELLETGNTLLLSRSPAVSRGTTEPTYQSRSLNAQPLYPTSEELIAAATGSSFPGIDHKVQTVSPAVIEVIHGSLAHAESPVLIGSYANDSMRGSADFLNGHLKGRMSRASILGRYPQKAGDVLVFFHPEENGRPAGAIVVGLGQLGKLLPGVLTQTLTAGMIEYARVSEEQCGKNLPLPESVEISAILVGAGFTGLTVETSTRCLLEALRKANAALKLADMKVQIGMLTIFEEVESRAVTTAQTVRDLVAEKQFSGVASFNGRLRDGKGGYRGRCMASGGAPGTYRVNIINKDGALEFTVITDRARNEVSAEPDQRQAVDGLIQSSTQTCLDQPGLSRALFELLVPNTMKEAVADLRTLMLSLDLAAASYPWELMRDSDRIKEPPLATRVEIIRQLASPHGRKQAETVQEKGIFIIGDTRSGLPELPGAQEEARIVDNCFLRAGYDVDILYRAGAQDVFKALFNGRYRFMHLAGHGVVNDSKTGLTGMVLGPETYLTSAQVTQLRRVPEFVFINCCHLGSMKEDAQPRWGQLAAGLATEFIEMGCKAVIAAGWAVNDRAAATFARTFYEAMLKGIRFGRAVRMARAETFRCHPDTNTWGAYQAYGDERHRFTQTDTENDHTTDYVHFSHIIADLDMLTARMREATDKDRTLYYRNRLTAIENSVRGKDYQHAGVREKLGLAWAELDEIERAIDHYRAAVGFEDGGLSLHSLEQLATLEISHGALLIRNKHTRKNGKAYMTAGLKRLRQLLSIGETVQRLSLLGTYWKHSLQLLDRATKQEEIIKALTEMQTSYWQAAELSYRRTGVWDYKPLLNALNGCILNTAWGETDQCTLYTENLQALLDAATSNARSRFQQSSDFSHALAEVEAKRIELIWGIFNGPEQDSITDQEKNRKLTELYRDLLQQRGGKATQKQATDQLIFLRDMLPDKETTHRLKTTLEQLIAEINSIVQ